MVVVELRDYKVLKDKDSTKKPLGVTEKKGKIQQKSPEGDKK